MRVLLSILLVLSHELNAQESGFAFGSVSLEELRMKKYAADTTAGALVLDEFGDAYIDAGTQELTVVYHVKLKIFDKSAYNKADFSVPLRKRDNKMETIAQISASTFNLDGNLKRESKMNVKATFTENYNEYLSVKKFTLPDVSVGSVLDVMYTIQSPFLFNFWPWTFQTDIPKVRSEFWTRIPGYYNYHIRLVGYLKLSKNDASIVRDCYVGGNHKVDCAVQKFGMTNIPAFNEEEYMTAKSNFLSALNFELSQVNRPDGRIDKYTKEWKDVDEELKGDFNFGLQIKKARNGLDEIKSVVAGKASTLEQSKAVYRHITNNFQWDGTMGKYAQNGLKKMIETRKGNVADVNLLLISALQSVGLKASPVILSTRTNGLPTELHPVLNDFNYVIAQLDIEGNKYLLDATEKTLPFGLLPERCLNGKGRLIGEESGWVELKAIEKEKEVTFFELRLDSSGAFQGTMSISHTGYNAVKSRRKIFSFTDRKEYLSSLEGEWKIIKVRSYDVKDLESLDQSFTETFGVSIDGFDNANADRLYFSPFITDRQNSNPLKSKERLYPVDFGAPTEKTLVLNLEVPSGFTLEDLPPNSALTLPAGGGKFVFTTSILNRKLTVTSSIVFNKPVYTSREYLNLRELFDRVVLAHQSVLVFNKNKQ